MDPLSGNRHTQRGIDSEGSSSSNPIEVEGTFRGSEGNRDVQFSPSPAAGEKRKRSQDADDFELEPPAKRRRQVHQEAIPMTEEFDEEESDEIQALIQSTDTGSRKMTKEEKSSLSAGGKKARTDGKKETRANVGTLRSFYLKQKIGKASPELFNFYARGYYGAIQSVLGHAETPKQRAQKLSVQNGRVQAYQGGALPNDATLRANFLRSHPEYKDNEDAIRAYINSYKDAFNSVSLTSEQRAQRLGEHNGRNQAYEGGALPDDATLRVNFLRSHPEFKDNEDAIRAYINIYKTAYLEL